MATAGLPVFEKFVAQLRAIWQSESDIERRMEKAKPLLEHLVKDPDLKAHSTRWPSTEGYKKPAPLRRFAAPFRHQCGRPRARSGRRRA
jgi:hypothetical protein